MKCPRCTMEFAVMQPKTSKTASTRCATPNCNLRFWHSRGRRDDSRVCVGVAPADAAAWSPWNQSRTQRGVRQ